MNLTDAGRNLDLALRQAQKSVEVKQVFMASNLT